MRLPQSPEADYQPRRFAIFICLATWILIHHFAFSTVLAAEIQNRPVTLTTAWSLERVRPGDEVVLAVIIDIADGFHINPDPTQIEPDSTFKPYPTRLRVTGASEGIILEAPRYPIAHPVRVAYAGGTTMAFSGRTTIYLPARIAPGIDDNRLSVTLEVAYQACDDKVCHFPQKRMLQTVILVSDTGAPSKRAHPQVFEGFARQAPAAASDQIGFDLFGIGFRIDAASGLGLLLLLMVAALGGFLLNLTPCVLPLIPIKIISLSNAATNQRRCLALGLSMFSGVIAFWLLLGAAIGLISGFTATNQLFQYPLFTIAIGIIIALMAFGMCGLFAVRLPNFIYAINPRQETLSGSFALGILAAILSTPCTAPFMGAAAAWAATRHPATTLMTFAAIGFGMALPYLVLSAAPGMVKKMPHSGPYSTMIKQIMGLFMLAAAAYFIGSGVSALLVSPPNPPGRWYWWIVMGLVAAGGVWMALRTWQLARQPIPRAINTFLGVLIVSASAMGAHHFTDPGPIEWVHYTPQRYQQALGQDQIVVMVFTAEWCLNCKALEQSVFKNEAVVDGLNRDDVAAIKVDITGHNPDGRSRLKATGILTIPLLVIYDSMGREVFKSDFYTPEQVLEALSRARTLD